MPTPTFIDSAIRRIKRALWPTYTGLARWGLLSGHRLLPHPVRLGYLGRHHRSRSVAQHGEDLILERILWRTLGLNPRDAHKDLQYADIGGFDPVHLSNTYLLYKRGCKGFVADPSRTTQKQFRLVRPRDIFIRAAIGSQSLPSVKLFVPKNNVWGDSSGQSSLTPNQSEAPMLIQEHVQLTFDDCMRAAGFHDIDVVSIDVEGAEVGVLEGLDWNRYRPKVFLIELCITTLEEISLSKLGKLLASRDYVLVASTHITHFFVDRNLFSQVNLENA
jgi:FkbM family methyltransferase